MLQVSVGEAKNKLPHFLHLVEEQNEEIQITRHGKPVAFINGKEMLDKADKKKKFLEAISSWREKYSDCLFSENEADSVFGCEKDGEYENLSS